MSGGRFEVALEATDAPQSFGLESAEFLVAGHAGTTPRALAKVASGGELSRIALSVAVVTSELDTGADAPGTLIFDEVDAGIGGRVADVVGARLQALGDRFQVLCITHLPQIAARGTTQFRIEKSVRGHRTLTTVERLDESGRIDEVARMIGGAAVSEPVRASARELLKQAHPGRDAAQSANAGERRKAKAKVPWRRNT
jgi:DNA repair protein RecN (Recombination protein N)